MVNGVIVAVEANGNCCDDDTGLDYNIKHITLLVNNI